MLSYSTINRFSSLSSSPQNPLSLITLFTQFTNNFIIESRIYTPSLYNTIDQDGSNKISSMFTYAFSSLPPHNISWFSFTNMNFPTQFSHSYSFILNHNSYLYWLQVQLLLVVLTQLLQNIKI